MPQLFIRKTIFIEKSVIDVFKLINDFKELMPYMAEHYKELVNGPPFSIFHKFNVVKGRVNYTIGFPIKYPIASSNQRYFVGSLPKMRVRSIEHLGPYRHLSNAWAAQMMYQRSKQFRPPKKRLYRNPVESYFLISRIKSS